jgi:hypothetical protein
MRLHRALALAGAAAGLLSAACKEPPFAPRWDANMYMPLSTQAIHLDRLVSPLTALPPGATRDSFVVQPQDASGVLGDLLKNMVTDSTRCTSTGSLSCDLLTLSLTKTTQVAVTDTLFVANSRSTLNPAGPGTIVFPVTLAATQTALTDSLYLPPESVRMLEGVGQSGDTLYVLLRGQVSNSSGSAIPVAAADSLGVSLSATILVAISHK